MKKNARLTALLLAMLMCGALGLSSCDVKDQAPESSTESETGSSTPEEIQIEGSYKIFYTSNGDGTCYVSDIRFFGEVKDLTLEIPETAHGKGRVVAYDTDALTHPEIARMLLPEDFEALIDAPMRQAVERGELSEFMYRKLLSFFERKSLEDFKDSAAKKLLLETYPILSVTDLYVFCQDLTDAEWGWISEHLERYTDYSPAKGIAAAKRLIVLTEQNNIHTSWIKCPIEPAELKGIVLPETLTRIHRYSFCAGDWVTEEENGVSYVSGWAVACDESVTELNLRPGTVGVADAAFSEKNLKSATLPDGILYIGEDAFSYGKDLTKVTLGEGLLHIGASAFNECKELTSINIPKSLKSIGENAFRTCLKMSSVHITDLKAWFGIEFDLYYSNPLCGASLYLNGEQVTQLVVPEGVTRINDYAFFQSNGLVSITIPDTVTEIGRSAFEDCHELESLTIGKSVSKIGFSAFDGCENLEAVDLPDSLTKMGAYVFDGCEKLLQTENGVVYADNWAVDADPSIADLTLRPGTVGIATYAFLYYDQSVPHAALTNLVLPKTLKYIGYMAFSHTNLTNVYYEGNAEEWAKITIDKLSQEKLQSAIVCYYSEAQPTTSGNYWRYLNGVPTAW